MEVTLGCEALFKYKRPDDMASKNAAPNVNRKTVLKMCLRGYLRIITNVTYSNNQSFTNPNSSNAHIFVTIGFRTYV
jgi:hypothetical protein